MRVKTTRWLAIVILSGSYIACRAQVRDTPLPLHRSIKGQLRQSEAKGLLEAIPPQSKCFSNSTKWDGFWKQFQIVPPAVDFERNSVIAVFAGQKPSSGYSVEVSRVSFSTASRELL